jgi:hypothetical protein
VLVALTKVDEYDPSVAASLPRVFSSAPIRNLISQVGSCTVASLHDFTETISATHSCCSSEVSLHNSHCFNVTSVYAAVLHRAIEVSVS